MKKTLKILFKCFLCILLLLILWILWILWFSYYNYHQGYSSVSVETKAILFSGLDTKDILVADTGSYRRTGNTFMSIPEWYIVSISDDYTMWLEAGENPSDFPYWKYLSDYWIIYGRITALMDDRIPRDSEYHTMIRVIGLSTTWELWFKSLYENSLWRISSVLSYQSWVDIFYAQSSRRYVDFILLRPWYEFPYQDEIGLLNHKNANSQWFRNTERKIFYLLEFWIKSFYAKIIEDVAHSTFAIPDIYTSVAGSFSGMSISAYSWVVTESSTLVKIPRYYPFTEMFPQFLQAFPDIVSVAGNTFIATEFISNSTDSFTWEFLRLPVNIESGTYRIFLFSPLHDIRNILTNSQLKLSHIYDF